MQNMDSNVSACMAGDNFCQFQVGSYFQVYLEKR